MREANICIYVAKTTRAVGPTSTTTQASQNVITLKILAAQLKEWQTFELNRLPVMLITLSETRTNC